MKNNENGAVITLPLIQTANALGISKPSLYRLIERDKSFPSFQVGGRTLVSADGLKE